MLLKKFSPCKINLMLAITGVRDDGFHNLISLVAPTKFGDNIEIEILENATKDVIECNMEGVPLDESNIVIKAAILFREATNTNNFYKFNLIKAIPHGAGLGGGSSNASTALLAINELAGKPLSMKKLEKIAAQLGSDCPLFLTQTPVVMRGRGELVFPLMGDAQDYISRLDLLLFKPDFSINTGWAYSQMKANPDVYIDYDKAESYISIWLENPNITGIPLINNMQIQAFKKYPALSVALTNIKEKFKIPASMSGSGSACFAILNDLTEEQIEELKTYIKSMFGETCFIARA